MNNNLSIQPSTPTHIIDSSSREAVIKDFTSRLALIEKEEKKEAIVQLETVFGELNQIDLKKTVV
jgi:uncharacterized protein YlaN (UPF0358 family)